MNHFADAGKTNPTCRGVAPAASPPRRGEAGSNPISKAKKMLLRLTINGRRESFGYYADEIRSCKGVRPGAAFKNL